MQCEISSVDAGWWIVSHEQKLWLPQGDLPHGSAENFGLTGTKARVIGEWQGEKVWLICEPRAESMFSVRQLIDLDVGLFQLAGRGVQLAEFYRSHRWCGYCGHQMHQRKHEFSCLCSH